MYPNDQDFFQDNQGNQQQFPVSKLLQKRQSQNQPSDDSDGSPQRKVKEQLNVNEIIARGDRDLYLSEEGVNPFEKLADPATMIKEAVKQGLKSANW